MNNSVYLRQICTELLLTPRQLTLDLANFEGTSPDWATLKRVMFDESGGEEFEQLRRRIDLYVKSRYEVANSFLKKFTKSGVIN